jgi:hypothetical protein
MVRRVAVDIATGVHLENDNHDEPTLGVGVSENQDTSHFSLLEVLITPESEFLNPISEDRNPLFMAAVVRADEP